MQNLSIVENSSGINALSFLTNVNHLLLTLPILQQLAQSKSHPRLLLYHLLLTIAHFVDTER
jgi:hypothetical protein